MNAKYILAIVGVGFLVAAGVRLVRAGGRLGPASKAWLIVGAVFVAVSLWLG